MTNNNFSKLFKLNRREEDKPLNQKHMDLAASIQKVIELIIIKITKESVEEIINRLVDKYKTNFKGVGQPLRIALTGSKFGPGIYNIILSLDKNEIIKRLKMIK